MMMEVSASLSPEGEGYVNYFDMPEYNGAFCTIEVPIPKGDSEWKRMRRDPTAWLVKATRKQEVSYGKLVPEERIKFDAAKEAEVSQWVKEAAARRVEGLIPSNRIMWMRWVLTYKENGSAKARIVVVGFEDPDLESLVSSSPTMSRRTRQLVYQMGDEGMAQHEGRCQSRLSSGLLQPTGQAGLCTSRTGTCQGFGGRTWTACGLVNAACRVVPACEQYPHAAGDGTAEDGTLCVVTGPMGEGCSHSLALDHGPCR